MIIAQSDAHNFDAVLNNNGLKPVGPLSVEAFQRTDVHSHDARRLIYNCSVLVDKGMASVRAVQHPTRAVAVRDVSLSQLAPRVH